MGKTRDTGYLRNLLSYDASGNITLTGTTASFSGSLAATSDHILGTIADNGVGYFRGSFNSVNTSASLAKVRFGGGEGSQFRAYMEVRQIWNGTGTDQDLGFVSFRGGVGSSEIVTIKGTGSVGIATDTPGSRFDVRVASGDTNQLRVSAASTIYKDIQWYDTTSGKMWIWSHRIASDGNKLMAWYNNGTSYNTNPALTIDTSNNVGINTSSPATLLHAKNTSSSAVIRADYNNTTTIDMTASSSGNAFISSNTNTIFETGSTPTERMRITSGGTVIMSAGQDVYITGSTDNRIRFSNYSFTGNSVGAAIGYIYGVANTQEQGNLAFYTNPNYNSTGSLTERMRITSSGNVGIANSLYAYNNIRPADQGSGGIDFYNSGIGYQYSAKIYTFKSPNGNEYYGFTNDYGSGTSAQLSMVAKEAGGSTGNIGFYVAAGVEKMRLTAAGRLGIGVSSPEGGLHVAQSGQDDQLVLGSSANNRDHAAFIYSGGNKAEFLRYQSGVRLMLGGSGNIQYVDVIPGAGAGARLNAGNTSWGSTSDIRLKKIDSNLVNCLNDIMTLRTIRYSLITETTPKLKLGLIAQEVEQVYPEIVDITKDGDLQDARSLRYSEMVPVLVRAIQELKAELDLLKNK